MYTQNMWRKDRSDVGIYAMKRSFLDIEGWCVEGTQGAKIVDEITPEPGDVVIVKKRPSAFFGTILNTMLIQRGVDTLVIVGGTTSNCIRATTIDAMSYCYRAIIPNDCVYDRVQISHEVSLLDLDRAYADVVPSQSVLKYFETLR